MKAKDFKNTYSFQYDLYPDTVWFSAREYPVNIYGLYNVYENKHFIRMPEDIAEKTSDGVRDMNLNPSGGRMTFVTDSPYIAIHAKEPACYVMPHMPRTGNAGFDSFIYNDDKSQIFACTFFPNVRSSQEFFASGNSRTNYGRPLKYVTYFPLYEKLDDVYIGVAPDAEFGEFKDFYSPLAPIVYYGSSITQGGCVSRPGNAYPAFISRRFNIDFINLGFSGSCKAEEPMIDYLSKLNMSIFVCDYDHNAPTVEHLKNTHYKLYERIREKNPNLPYVMVSKPDTLWHNDYIERREVILSSYNKAKANGDENVYFIDGDIFFKGEYFDACTVDDTHPNDIGHYLMGKYIGDVIGEILNK